MRSAVEVVGSGPAVDAIVAALGVALPSSRDDESRTHAGDGGQTVSDDDEHGADGDPTDDADPSPGDDIAEATDDDAVRAVRVEQRDTPHFEDVTVAVVVGRVGADVFDVASDAGRATGTPWIAVEIGGIGGYPITEASVAGFDPTRECYQCLRTRVGANVDPDADPVGVPDEATQWYVGALAARKTVPVVHEEGTDVLGTVTEVPYDDHRFLPVPGCECGDEREMLPRRGSGALDVESALREGERGLDERVGIVRQVGEVDSFPTPYYLAQLTDTGSFSDATAPQQAAGVATDWNRAFLKALGESYERYAAGVYRHEDTTRAAAATLDAAVPPTAFVTPEDPGWSEGDEIEWVRGKNLSTDGEVFLPSSLVFHPPPERQFRPAITTGLGLHTSPSRAIVAGLTEVIERDAAMLAWYSSFEPLGLAVDDDRFETLATRVRAEGLTVRPLLLTQDVDVAVVAVALHREEWPQFAVGSSAALDASEAACAALEEAVQNWMELRNMGPEPARAASGAIGEYAEMPKQAEDFVDAEQTVPADSVGTDAPEDGDAILDTLLERAVDAGLSVYASRTTTRDLATLGFESVRVLVPSAQPLFFETPYFGERATTVPGELGFEPLLDRRHHPFP